MLSIVRSRGALTRRFVPKKYFSWIHDGLRDGVRSADAAGHCEAVLAGGERDDRRGVEQGRNGLVARVLGDLDEVREHERHADG